MESNIAQMQHPATLYPHILWLAAGLVAMPMAAHATSDAKPVVHAASRKPPQARNHADWLKQAQTLEQSEAWAALLEWAEKWAASDSRSAMARYVQGRAYSGLKRYPEAIGAYLHTLRLNPDDVYALNNLGNAYRQIGRFQDALLSYREALRVNPDCIRAWYNIGVTYYGLKGQTGVSEALKEAEGINPEIAVAWHNLFLNYTRGDDEIATMEAVRNLGRQNPADLDRLFNLLLSRLDA
jgi:tetratricopeptide (TPR) repeat protein